VTKSSKRRSSVQPNRPRPWINFHPHTS
jgi:hypothetical protein